MHVAQKIQTLFIDDIDGSAAEGTVRFALDGMDDEIDLNKQHAEALRKAMAKYVDAARRSSGTAAARRPARGGRRTSASGLNTTEVREWAKAQGIEVKDRGRVPAEFGGQVPGGHGKLGSRPGPGLSRMLCPPASPERGRHSFF